MQSEQMLNVSYTKEVKRNLKELSKKYRNIKTDIQPSIDELTKGNLIGDRIPNLGEKAPGVPYCIYKARIQNTNNNKGKSAGYRLIYEVLNELEILIITIYSKADQSSISSQQIKEILDKLATVSSDNQPETE